MKKIMMFIMVGALVIGSSVLSFADSISSPLDILSNLTGISVEEVVEQRVDGQRLGELAAELNVYDEFHEAFLNGKLAALKEKVESGDLSQEDYDALVEKLEDCDGTGSNSVLKGLGMQFGKGSGNGRNKDANSNGNGFFRNGNGNRYGNEQ